MKPEELLSAHPKDCDWFSVVITGFEGLMTTEHIQSKIYVPDDNGGYRRTNSGAYMSHYTNQTEYEEGIELYPVNHFSTCISSYDKLDKDAKEVVDGLKHLLNNFPSAAFWHDGNVDDACQFNGLHLHVLAAVDKKLSQITMIRTLKTKLARHNVTVRCQHVRYIENLCRHLQTEPSVLLGCNNLDLCAILRRTKPLTEAQQEPHVDTDFKMDEIYEEEIEESKRGSQLDKEKVECSETRK